MRELHAWMEDRHVGVFYQSTDEEIRFVYDHDVNTPISLSLPLQGGWTRRSPARFLDNLLPDDANTREAMRRAVHANEADSFSLLDGADATGGLVFTSNPEPPDPSRMPAVLASDADIAYRIISMRNSPASWWQSDQRIRFSLAGNQPKFSLLRIGDHWAWSNAANPSSHIIKPAPAGDEGDRMHSIRDADIIETTSMKLAELCGMAIPHSGLIVFDGEPAYIVERFDRYTRDDGIIGRIHTEDMLQALGLPPKDKYHVKARMILSRLHEADPSDRLSYEWIAQLALNTAISNADAHAKNYSLLIRSEGVSLSPMYDVLTTTYWPKVDRSLPMSIGGVRGAANLTPYHWRRFALDNHLDEERVVTIARTMSGRILDHMEEAYQDLSAGMRDILINELRKANQNMEPIRERRDWDFAAMLEETDRNDHGRS